MGWRFRRVFGAGPFRWTWTKKGVGWSLGLGIFRYGFAPDGRRYISVGLPGTGWYYIKYLGKNKPSATATSTLPSQAAQQQPQQALKTQMPACWTQKLP